MITISAETKGAASREGSGALVIVLIKEIAVILGILQPASVRAHALSQVRTKIVPVRATKQKMRIFLSPHYHQRGTLGGKAVPPEFEPARKIAVCARNKWIFPVIPACV